jgi:hypothetical protein
MTTAEPGAAPGEGPPQRSEAECSIAALRARGAHRLDPVHFHFLEVLARRAAAQPGPTGHWLARRLAQLTAAYGQRAAQAASDAGAPSSRLGAGAAQPAAAADRVGPLAELVRALDSQAAPAEGARPAAGPAGPTCPAGPTFPARPAGAPPELKALRDFGGTWGRLRVQRQLRLSQAQVPANAGPLHSERLVLRSLQALQALSPAYLGRFMAQVEALFWLEQVPPGAPVVAGEGPRAEGEKKRKAARGRPGG